MWKPDKVLIDLLRNIGVDEDVLQSTIHNSDAMQSLPNTPALNSAFTYSVLDKQQRKDSKRSREPNTKTIIPIDKNWHSSKETQALLLGQLNISEYDLSYIRYSFIQDNLRKGSHRWDFLFICYAIEVTQQHIKNSKKKQKDGEIDKTTYQYNHELEEHIRSLSERFTPHRRTLDKYWEPPKWLLEKLISEKIERSFIYNRATLETFISHFNANNNIYSTTNESHLFYEWITSRHKKAIKLNIKI